MTEKINAAFNTTWKPCRLKHKQFELANAKRQGTAVPIPEKKRSASVH